MQRWRAKREKERTAAPAKDVAEKSHPTVSANDLDCDQKLLLVYLYRPRAASGGKAHFG
jgi:hypothetical protein